MNQECANENMKKDVYQFIASCSCDALLSVIMKPFVLKWVKSWKSKSGRRCAKEALKKLVSFLESNPTNEDVLCMARSTAMLAFIISKRLKKAASKGGDALANPFKTIKKNAIKRFVKSCKGNTDALLSGSISSSVFIDRMIKHADLKGQGVSMYGF